LYFELGWVVIASKQLPLLEAIITFQKLRKFNFGKVIIASSRRKTLLETKNVYNKNYKKKISLKKSLVEDSNRRPFARQNTLSQHLNIVKILKYMIIQTIYQIF
jgi:hypothetical protein